MANRKAGSTTRVARIASQPLSVGVRAGLGFGGGALAGSGNRKWLIVNVVTARNSPLTRATITSSARPNSAVPAELIKVSPTTRKVATSGLPPRKP
ncbi:hypothetical protein D3C86_1933500 [compost metagenome]